MNADRESLFASCAFHFLRAGRRVSMLPEGFVHQSKTIVIAPKKEEVQ
ncbi:MAG TPA: hypothetical protein PKA41_02025 [Verrucomicrobiota bacterium]|nr:hypothetical protein [Verrucomicrobiota bacterium]